MVGCLTGWAKDLQFLWQDFWDDLALAFWLNRILPCEKTLEEKPFFLVREGWSHLGFYDFSRFFDKTVYKEALRPYLPILYYNPHIHNISYMLVISQICPFASDSVSDKTCPVFFSSGSVRSIALPWGVSNGQLSYDSFEHGITIICSGSTDGQIDGNRK
jgi:hypothetical protein